MSSVLDEAVLDDLVGHIGDDAARAVIALFLDECRELTAAIAKPGAEPAAIARAAHSLKSSAGQLGAAALSDVALAVETAAADEAATPAALVTALGQCARATRDALAARLAG